ncbi:malto-oligosyltrehalose synthase [Chlorogloeopsis sp. ULAP01]|uniref:malto-oligosyltrehalose synthase n=1 Tax=Chlorogloeopsis sp. ULAP01 TaxID=3056483 RepID=UPI0025AA9AB5|nr:malto-oligosyltrehalose synthase [Chlorogloeopsis sp. ULAP01]MDM9385679.1 malto-oligosyltrehalose synthase [Chlorogloeopsis sp. ULAP01]
MQIPIATYRIQFTPEFGFANAKAIASFLAELGISHIYASPILTARKGSTHGYDTVNYNEISPELGGKEKFEELIEELNQLNIGWVQDIVPNHMAFDSQNQMLVDVLENGSDSQYRDFFDITWNHHYEENRGKVLAPFLGKFCGDCLESGELQLQYDQNGITINYYSLKFPIKVESYYQVLTYDLGRLREKIGRDHPCFMKLLSVLYMLKYTPSGEEGRERYDQISIIKRMLWELWNDSSEVKEFIEENIRVFNGEAGKAESFNLLENLLSDQFYRLSYWKVGNEELNYRRFFTVNELICLRIEEEQVFDNTHALILELVKEEKFNGLRIDHIDGLYDPAKYLNLLREHAPEVYLVVEKILEPKEELPITWPIQGTTGYDFLNQVNGIFCLQSAEQEFDDIYHRFIRKQVFCEDLIDQKKRLIINKDLAGDIDNLAHLLKQISGRYRYASDFTMYGLKAALVEILAVFPIYRTYISSTGASKTDKEYIQQVLDRAKQNIPNFLNELNFIEKFLHLDFDESLKEEDKQQWLRFVMRLQQMTGPLMAKGVEDTVMYVYNRLLSLNEVGSHPAHFGISLEDFHTFNQNRFAAWPHAMNTTSTHDTKRGEDVRARINVLSEIPQEWESNLKQWREINAPQKISVGGRDVPTPNDEYLFYQSLIGAFPFKDEEYPQFVERMQQYIIKAIREAKVHTAWLKPDTDYENTFTQFAEQVLKEPENNPFLEAFRPFQRKIQYYGVFNSLSQTLLRLTSPGVPDTYQGTELWDLSLVDPDNRRPVDYQARQEYLQDIKSKIETDLPGLITELLQNPEDGRIKMFLTYQVLQARRQHLEVFQRGAYSKLTVAGSLKSHVVGFARELGDKKILAIAPRFFTSLVKEGEYPLGEQIWQETRIVPPADSSPVWQDAITGQQVQGEDTLWVREILQKFPVALLVNQSEE